jgi:nucleotide-binding universal stress UspA family protein
MASLQSQERPTVRRPATAKLHSSKVLVVIDGSERTGRVIGYALSLAQDRPVDVEVVLLGIVPKPPDGRLRGYGSFKRDEIHAHLKDAHGQRAVSAAARRFNQAGVSHKDRIEVGDPAETILRVASEEGCDVVLIGAAPAGAFRRWLLKVIGLSAATVASQVAQLAVVPVVVVK